MRFSLMPEKDLKLRKNDLYLTILKMILMRGQKQKWKKTIEKKMHSKNRIFFKTINII